MPTTFWPDNRGSRINGWLFVALGALGFALVVGLGGLLGACGGDPVAKTSSVVERLAAGWSAEDPDVLSPLFADEVQGYDANMPGWSWDKQDGETMLRDPKWWENFDIEMGGAFFVSADGRFAASAGKFSSNAPGLERVLGASIYEIKNEQVVWDYDYYGGSVSQTEPMPAFPTGTIKPGSSEAKTAIAAATATLKQWVAAYNSRNAEAFLASYADNAKHMDVVSPDWRVMTKSELAADVASHFPRADFKSRLEPSPSAALSPLADSFFVSADGRFAAAQGSYKDVGVSVAAPMLVILELQGGKIVKQYNLMLVERDLLQP
jgi:hypothetical protein